MVQDSALAAVCSLTANDASPVRPLLQCRRTLLIGWLNSSLVLGPSSVISSYGRYSPPWYGVIGASCSFKALLATEPEASAGSSLSTPLSFSSPLKNRGRMRARRSTTVILRCNPLAACPVSRPNCDYKGRAQSRSVCPARI